MPDMPVKRCGADTCLEAEVQNQFYSSFAVKEKGRWWCQEKGSRVLFTLSSCAVALYTLGELHY